MNARVPYESPLRKEQAAATRARIVEACVGLIRSGRELTYPGVASLARVRERTVYRHFPAKRDLEIALQGWVRQHLFDVELSAQNMDELMSVIHAWFEGFEKDAPLLRAMLHSAEGLNIRRAAKPQQDAMYQRCVDAALPDAPPEVRRRAAASLQVISSAAAWDFLRVYEGLDAAGAAAVVELGINSVIEGLRVQYPEQSATRPRVLPSAARRKAS